jgi:hypothetical protein
MSKHKKYPIIHRTNNKYHNVNGPAWLYQDGGWGWWMHGERHRYYGPSILIVNLSVGRKYIWIVRNITIKVDVVYD